MFRMKSMFVHRAYALSYNCFESRSKDYVFSTLFIPADGWHATHSCVEQTRARFCAFVPEPDDGGSESPRKIIIRRRSRRGHFACSTGAVAPRGAGGLTWLGERGRGEAEAGRVWGNGGRGGREGGREGGSRIPDSPRRALMRSALLQGDVEVIMHWRERVLDAVDVSAPKR
ncbi:hypothetical protein C8R44DRAFT_732645 [Mycena epipterygia]|nr:hypothetical protein C8R44DRAFT_732645 [Mycena epipterygia]